MRVVLDTNVLLVSIGTHSPYRPIFNALSAGRLRLLLTTDIYFEYLEKLQQKTNTVVANNIAKFLLELKTTERIMVHYKWNLIYTDPDDNKFSDCGLAANADYLVSDDADFRILKRIPFPSLNVITAKDLLSLLAQ